MDKSLWAYISFLLLLEQITTNLVLKIIAIYYSTILSARSLDTALLTGILYLGFYKIENQVLEIFGSHLEALWGRVQVHPFPCNCRTKASSQPRPAFGLRDCLLDLAPGHLYLKASKAHQIFLMIGISLTFLLQLEKILCFWVNLIILGLYDTGWSPFITFAKLLLPYSQIPRELGMDIFVGHSVYHGICVLIYLGLNTIVEWLCCKVGVYLTLQKRNMSVCMWKFCLFHILVNTCYCQSFLV